MIFVAHLILSCACFMLRGRDTHIDFLRLLFLVGMIDDLPSDARSFFLPLLKHKVVHLRNGSFKEMITGSTAPTRPSFLPFYFRVRDFSIQRARLSRNLEQAISTDTFYIYMYYVPRKKSFFVTFDY